MMRRNQFLLAAILSVGAGLNGCSGPIVHKNLREDPHVLVRQWTKPTFAGLRNAGDRGTEYSSAILYENVLIYGTQTLGVVCLYPKLDVEKWRFAVSGGVNGGITVEKGIVYFGGGDGFIYAVNLDTGKLQWKYEVRNTLVSKPTVYGGRAFVTTTDDTIYAFDAGTGKWLWHYRRRSAPSASIHAASSPFVEGNDVIAGLSDGFLVSVGVQDGSLKWERKLHTGAKFTDVDAHPVMADNTLYVPAYDGSLYALKRDNGEILWRFEAGGSKTVLIDGERLFLPSSDGAVFAIQRSTGKELWKFELDGGIPTELVLTDRYLIFGSSHQYVYAIDRGTGQGMYRLNIGMDTGFSGAPAYDSANKNIYLLSHGGNLYKLWVRDSIPAQRRFGQTDGYVF